MPRKAKSAAARARKRKQIYENSVKSRQSNANPVVDVVGSESKHDDGKEHEINMSCEMMDESSRTQRSLPPSYSQVVKRKVDNANDIVLDLTFKTAKYDQSIQPNNEQWPKPAESHNYGQTLPLESRMALTHQADYNLFGDIAGSQCMPSCYIAIGKLLVERTCSTWNGKTVIELIELGSTMYLKHKPKAHVHFSVADLPDSFKLDNHTLHLQSVTERTGMIEYEQQTPDDVMNNIYHNITDCFHDSSVTGLLLTMAGYTVAILKDGFEYWVFDTHSRNVNGKPSSSGSAGMFRYGDIFDLARYVIEMNKELSGPNTSIYAYELACIHLAKKSNIDDPKAQKYKTSNLSKDPSSCGITTLKPKASYPTVDIDNSMQSEYLIESLGCLKGIASEHSSDSFLYTISDNTGMAISEDYITASDRKQSCETLPQESRMAEAHQGDSSRFGDIAGSQCMTSCYCAIGKMFVDRTCATWTGKTILDLISLGSDMYRHHKPNYHVFFSVEDLPTTFEINSNTLHLQSVRKETGMIEYEQQTHEDVMNNIYLNITNLIQDKSSAGLLLTMAEYTIAILKDGPDYWVLDTHSRDVNGRPSSNGSAGMFRYSNTLELTRYIVEMNEKISGLGSCATAYELALIQLTIHSNSKLDSLQSKAQARSRESQTTDYTSKSCVTASPLPVKGRQLGNDPSRVAGNQLSNSYPVIKNGSFDPRYDETDTKTYKNRYAKYYAENMKYRSQKRKNSKRKYFEDEQHRNALKEHSIETYAQDEQHRNALKTRSIEKYAENEQHRNALKTRNIKKYEENEQHRYALKTRSIAKYEENQQHRNALKMRSIAKYAENQQHRNALKTRSIAKYAENELHRNALKTRSIEKYEDNEQHRNALKTRSIAKYAENELHRNALKTRSIEKYEENEQHRNALKTRSREKYSQNEIHRQAVIEYGKQKHKEQRTKKTDIGIATDEFRSKCHEAPTSICCVCTRLFFADKVNVFKLQNFNNRTVLTPCLEYYKQRFDQQGSEKLFICHTCSSYIKRDETPPQASVNNMKLSVPDPTFDNLNTLEQQLIALFVPFEKIITLPRSKQYGMRGPVVCVPSSIKRTTDALPVPAGESKIVPVYLKRKLIYQGYSNFQHVDTVKINVALHKLKRQNPLYSEVEINENWDDIIASDLLSAENDEGTCGEEDDSDEHVVIPGHVMDSCLQPVDLFNEIDSDNVLNLSIAPAEGNTPVSIFNEPMVEAKSFPSLFPSGSNTYDEERPVKVSRCDYYKARIFSADQRFASNTNYIFFSQYAYECEKILSSISINLRKGSDSSKIHRNMLSDPESLRTLLKSDTGFKYFEPVRGSPAFWKKTMSNLFACLRNLGLPTFFVTLTSAELSRWTCHLGAILKQRGDFRSDADILNMDYKEKCEVLKSNPVTAVQMFYNRVDLFFKLILLGPSQPIGKIKDYFYRVEFQARGAPHLHCLFWIEDAPIYGVQSNEAIEQFIEQYISGQLPDEFQDPELHDVVSKVQMHSRNHSASCRKGKHKKACRFNFPKPCSDATFIVEPKESDANQLKIHEDMLKTMVTILEGKEEVADNEELYRKCGVQGFEQFQEAMRFVAKKPSVVLKRTQRDIYVNNYNPDLLRAWNANIDIQYVLDAYSCIMYIVSYIAKSESELGEVLKQARTEMAQRGDNCNDAKGMRSLAQKYFTHREVSVQEAVVRLSGFKLQQFSRQVVFIPSNEEDLKMSKPLKKIMESPADDNCSLWLPSVYDKYYARPEAIEFNDMCIAEFLSDYRILSTTEAKKCKSNVKYTLGKGLGTILKRTRSQPAVIRYCRHSPTAQTEKYYLTLLKLFLPHRKASDIKPEKYHTYEEYFQTGAVQISQKGHQQTLFVSHIVRKNEARFNYGDTTIDEGFKTLSSEGGLEDAWASVAPNAEFDNQNDLIEGETCTEKDCEVIETNPDFVNATNQRTPGLCTYTMSPSTLKPLLQSMNSKQQKLFYYVRDWCIKSKNNSQGLKAFHIFATGGAGVGKSHLIKCLYGACTKILRKSETPGDITVLLLAPTGTAAHNINGRTIHSVFKIPVKHSNVYQPLSCDTLNSLRSSLENLKMIIVDEVSMVSGHLLDYLNCRLKQIMGVRHSDPDGDFGNVSVLAVGDFHQLSPVMATSLVLPSNDFKNELFRDKFKLVELDEIMRQKDDAVFANVLNRLRIKAPKSIIDPDIDEMLKSRTNRDDEPATALHVFGKNKNVDQYNQEMVETQCDQVHEINAMDYQKDSNGKLHLLDKAKKGNSSALPDILKVGLNARVMLLRNIDVEHGLANGVFGTVKKIEVKENRIAEIYVKFDDERVGSGVNQNIPPGLPPNTVCVKRVEEPLQLSSNRKVSMITRRQFPLKLGWASTVHKTQGMSVSQIVYDMGDTFAAGQAYVAMSRAISLRGLFLKNYSADAIYRDENVYRELSNLSTLDLGHHDDTDFADVVVHNVQGLVNKQQDIIATYSRRASIMCLTETWMSANNSNDSISLDGFNIFRQDRQSTAQSNRGGVTVYTKAELPVQRIETPGNYGRHLESVAIHVTIKQRKVLIVSLYRPGSLNISVSTQIISEHIDQIEQQENIDVFIWTGDLNENLLDSASHPLYKLFTTRGYTQLVTNSTYLSGSLLDVVYVKGTIECISARVCPIYFSDHEVVTIRIS